MDKEELLAFAIKHYPRDTEYRSCVSGAIYISTGNYYESNNRIRENCMHNPWLFYNGKWAVIVSLPIIKSNYYFY